MHYSGNIYRPPTEAYSTFLQVTQGCSHNNCRFCSMYKGNKFKVSPIKEVEDDILELKNRNDHVGNIFLLGGDAFVLSYEKLRAILEMIKEHLPSRKRVTCYARVNNIKDKTVEQLKVLYDLGLTHLYVGFESGDDETLAMVNKGHNSEEMIEQLQKLDAVNIGYSMGYILGLGGKGTTQRNGVESARVINQFNPELIGISGLLLFPDSDLSQDKTFVEAGEVEKFEELKAFIENVEIETTITMQHMSNLVQINGKLPDDREKMLSQVQHAIDTIDEDYMRKMRNSVAQGGRL